MDLISRQAAINTVLNIRQKCDTNDIDEYRDILVECFEELPTAEKRGEWIPVVDGNYIIWECSECHVESEAWTDYCPICGSRNIEINREAVIDAQDEEAYKEALEEFRKNPKTYTLDEVEAELGLTAELMLNNPITPEQWDLLEDVDFDHTDRIWFHTKHDKDVAFVKERKGKWMPNNVVNAVCPWCCSECNSNQADRTPYCQMCGARMEENDGGLV